MISFRHHVVSLVAVLVALAAGIALGGGPLSDLGRTASPKLRAENDQLRAELTAAHGATGLADGLAEQYADRLVGGTLKELRIALVTLPGSDSKIASGLSETVKLAGGAVVATYELQAKAYNTSGKSLVDTLGAQLADDVDAVPADATTYTRLGALLAAGIVGDGEAATSLLSSLGSAGLVTAPDEPAPADLVLVVVGQKASVVETDALAGLFTGLDGGVDGSVVVASTGSAESGLLRGLRADPTWSEVGSSADSAQTGAGRISAVLALAADAAGGTGHYGAFGSDGAAPGSD